jgi:hypothetical protein
MATTTYTPIESKTLGSSASSVTFTSIPSTYTDLVLIVNGGTSSGSNSLYMRFNNDSTSIYSTTYMYGNGSSATPGRLTTRDAAAIGYFVAPGTGNEFNSIAHIQNYANTNVYKTVLDRANSTAGTYPGAEASVSLWRSNAAINRIDVLITTNTINAGTTFTLYGIANANIGAPKAQGGTITYDDTYFYHTFGSSGTFTPQQSLTADVLVVAGGGGGGGRRGSGGGAGGLLGFASQSLSATGYTVTVGAGGIGGTGVGADATTGGDSQFGALTLVKGGGRGADATGPSVGGNGGSGGGGIDGDAGGTATSGQGNNGGGSTGGAPNYGGGGGGGATVAGGGATTTTSGAGGNGSSAYSSYGLATGTGQNISGTVWYAGGGSGGLYQGGTLGAAGNGGGGLGTLNDTTAGAGLPNTGGGGGGGGYQSVGANGGAGGSGIVIVRYLKA